MDNVKAVIGGILIVACGVLGVIFGFYLLFGFCAWVANDPLDLFQDGPLMIENNSYSEGERKWDDCAYSARTIYDDFNDTVGATYALEDTPSNDVQDFMKLCLEKNI